MSAKKLKRLDLIVDSDGHGGHNYLAIDYADRAPIDSGNTSAAAVRDMRAFLETKYYPTFRRSTNTLLANGQYDVAWLNLSGLGRHLYTNLVPTKVKKIVNSLDLGNHLHIVSDNLDIPWELVRNGDEFWGRMYVISRAKRSANLRLRRRTRRATKVVNVIGASMRSSVESRATRLFERFKGNYQLQVVTISGNDPDATSKLYKEIPAADIIHFTCHGQIQNGNVYLQIVKDISDAFNFMVTTIQALKIKRDCLVFANACLSGTPQRLFRQSLGFGSEFCAKGKEAAAFIGTLDFVPDTGAVLFAERYYKELFTGKSIGDALLAAKNADYSHLDNA